MGASNRNVSIAAEKSDRNEKTEEKPPVAGIYRPRTTLEEPGKEEANLTGGGGKLARRESEKKVPPRTTY